MHHRSVTELTTDFYFNVFSQRIFKSISVLIDALVSFQFLLTPSHGLGVVMYALWYKIISNLFVGRLSGVAGGGLDMCPILWENLYDV